MEQENREIIEELKNRRTARKLAREIFLKYSRKASIDGENKIEKFINKENKWLEMWEMITETIGEKAGANDVILIYIDALNWTIAESIEKEGKKLSVLMKIDQKGVNIALKQFEEKYYKEYVSYCLNTGKKYLSSSKELIMICELDEYLI